MFDRGSVMEARIVGFKGTKRSANTRYCIVESDAQNPASLIGEKVVWRSDGGKVIAGTIIRTHGKNRIMARFSRGLPGTALGTPLAIKKFEVLREAEAKSKKEKVKEKRKKTEKKKKKPEKEKVKAKKEKKGKTKVKKETKKEPKGKRKTVEPKKEKPKAAAKKKKPAVKAKSAKKTTKKTKKAT